MSKKSIDDRAKDVWRVISHDWVSPLTVIRYQQEQVDKNLPLLIETYNLAKNAGLNVPEISDKDLERLKIVTDSENSKVAYLWQYLTRMNKKFMYTELPTEPKSFSIKECVNNSINSFEPVYGFDENYSLKVDLVEGGILGNPDTLTYVCYELLSNADYYLRHAGSGATLSISGKSDGGEYYLSFKNDGVGITNDDLAKVFEPYFSTRNKIGLGLYYVDNAVKTLGGKIECFSNEKDYVEFILEFPIIR